MILKLSRKVALFKYISSPECTWNAVLRIREILVRIRIRRSVPLTTDPDSNPTPDSDPDIFVSDLQDGNKK
jgi:hypothetical protein